MEDLNPSGLTGEQLGVGPCMEKLWTDSVLESPGARWFSEDSTTAADGVGGGERSATMIGDSTAMPGATARAIESSKAEARATRVVVELGVQRPAGSKE